MKKFSKIAVILLSVALLLGTLVFVAGADDGYVAKVGNQEYTAENFGNAIADAAKIEGGGTVILTGDLIVTETIKPTGTVTIDLNGYTLTSNVSALFSITESDTKLTITGDGVIVTAGTLVSHVEGSTVNLTGIEVNVKGEAAGITINHTGEVNNKLMYMTKGTWNFENLKVYTAYDTTRAFFSPNLLNANGFQKASGNEPTLFINYKACEINATATSATATVFQVSSHAQVTMDYCSVTTNGSLFNFQNDDYYTPATYNEDGTVATWSSARINDTDMFTKLNVTNSKLLVSNPLGTGSGNGSFSGSSYSEISGDIILDNTYVGVYGRMNMKKSYGESAIYLKNGSVWEVLANQNLSRGAAVIVESGSMIKYAVARTGNLYANDTSKESEVNASPSPAGKQIALVFNEGARIDANTYTAIVTNRYVGPYTAYETIQFSDRSSILESTTYAFVYDPSVSEAPYKVVKATEVSDYLSADFIADGSDLRPEYVMSSASTTYYNYSLWPFLYHNAVAKNIVPVIMADGNTAIKIAKTTDNQYNNRFSFGLKDGILETSRDVIVIDFDLGSPSVGSNMSAGNLKIQTKTSTGDDDLKQVFTIGSGQIKSGTATAGEANKTTWQHCTIVIDTTVSCGRAFVYVNGALLTTTQAYANDGATIYGILYRFNTSNPASLLFDNVVMRSYGDGTSTTPLTQTDAYDYADTDKYNVPVNSGSIANTALADYKEPNSAFTVGGMDVDLSDVTEAVDEVPTLKYPVHLESDYTFTSPIDFNGIIANSGYNVTDGAVTAYSHKLSFPTESNSFDRFYDVNGNVTAYEFNDDYKAYEVTLKWFTGTNPDSALQLADEANWSETKVITSGIIPSTLNTATPYKYKLSRVDGQNYYFTTPNNIWLVEGDELVIADGEHIDATFTKAYNGKTVRLLPGYGTEETVNPYKYITLDANGAFKRGSTDTLYGSRWNASHANGVHFTYGDTFVFLADVAMLGNFSPIRDSSIENKVLNIDFNGHTITTDYANNDTQCAPEPFFANEGETLNLYSSVDGAKVILTGYYKGESTVAGSRIAKHTYSGVFVNVNAGGTIAANATDAIDNTVVNIGMGNGTLHVECDTLVLAKSGDTSCAVNVDGVEMVRTTHYVSADGNRKDKNGVFELEAYSGAINVTNSDFILAAGGPLVNSKGWLSSEKNPNATGEDDKYTADCVHSLCDLVFDGCTVITNENTDGSNTSANLMADRYGFNSILFKNFVSNGRVNPANGPVEGVVKAENVSAPAIPTTPSEGYKLADYYVPMTYDKFTASYFLYDSEADTVTETSFIVAPYGYEGDDATLVLPVLKYKVAPQNEVLKVTYAGLGENGATQVDNYALGGFIQDKTASLTVADYVGTALQLTHTGEWSARPTGAVTEDVTVYPEYEVISTVEDVQTNLSIYSDFGVNLYIPIEYKGLITVSVAGVDLELTDVDLDADGNADVYRATVRQSVENVSETVEFVLTVTEADETLKLNANVNIVDYANTILADTECATYTLSERYLMYYMLAYANEAVKYFNKAEDANISGIVATYTEALNQFEVSEYNNVADTSVIGKAIAEATISLTSAPNFVFTLADGFAGTVTVSDGTNVRTFENITASASRVLVVKDMRVYNFASRLTITAVGTVGEEEVNVSGYYNLDTFVNYHVTQSANEVAESVACEPLLRAFYNYVVVANGYKANTLVPAVSE